MDVSRTSIVKINDLPIEMLSEIFNHLDVQDVMNCMMVSKLWKSVCRDFRLKELIFKEVIGESEWSTIESEWCTKELLDPKNMISSQFLSRLRFPRELINVRRLYLETFGSSQHFNLHHLNSYHNLQHLQLSFFEPKQKTFLTLPNLKILKCFILGDITFTTPNLSSLYLRASSQVRFRNLPTLKYFEYDRLILPEFNDIENVEVYRSFYKRNFHCLYIVLTKLKNVREIWWDGKLDNYLEYGDFKEWVNIILERRRQLKKTNVKIYIFGILLEDGKEFDEYGFYKIKSTST